MEANKDVIIDFPKIMQKFMDNRDNRRNYSRSVYLTNKHNWQDGGDYKNDPIVFKQKTKFKDKYGKDIFEWDYVLVKGKKCLVTINGRIWQYTDSLGYSGCLPFKESKHLEIVGQKEFNGKIIIKGINMLEDKISKMDIWASAIIDEYQNIRNGSK